MSATHSAAVLASDEVGLAHSVPRAAKPAPTRAWRRRSSVVPSAPTATVGSAPELPDSALLGRIAIMVFEVITGVRVVAQLGKLVTFEVAQNLAQLRALRCEHAMQTASAKRVVPTVQGVHRSSPTPGTLEAAVILNTAASALAVALRAEHDRGRWRVTAVTVL
ncbi:Rv3235 family protein [Leucobacter sp. 1207-22]|uniref:Rv3235 family protein n=1 Tax=Leucobacter sp. 1207-22 TaxID=2604456 RepID=UPI0040637BB5